MEIVEKFKTNFLKPAKYNPRIMDEEEHQELNESLKYFGLTDPIIFNTKTGVIIGGNQRWEHVKDQKEGFALLLGDIGWYFTEDNLELKTDEDERLLNIALNKINGYFNDIQLKPLVEEIIDSDIPLIGFNDMEINQILGQTFEDVDMETPDPETSGEYEKDVEKHKNKTYYLKPGDTWKFGSHALTIGDINPDQKINITIKGEDLKLTFASTENVEEELYLFISHNKNVINENAPNYDEET